METSQVGCNVNMAEKHSGKSFQPSNILFLIKRRRKKEIPDSTFQRLRKGYNNGDFDDDNNEIGFEQLH